MGIPYYFASLIRKHPRIAQRVRSKLHVAFLGIDFNCLIHNYLDDARPIESVLEAIEMILRDVCSADRVFIAMDGLVPYAKIVQQRYRRFRKSTAETPPLFDRHQISPGTPYMRDLATAVRARFPEIEVSCTAEPGEGEHKIFQTMKMKTGVETVIYGLDADLILLSLPYPNVRLLRENPDFQIKDSGFSALSIRELAKVLPLPVPQYVALCVLCFGNDFMPSLGMFSLREGGHERALDLYGKSGKPDMLTPTGRAHFLNFARAVETDFYKTRSDKRHPAIISSDMKHFEARYISHILDGPVDMSAVVRDFWKCFHWTMIYFTTNSVPDWNYVYSYPEAPLVSQILRQFPEDAPTFEKVAPAFTVTKQLQFILPSASLRTAKKRVLFPDELYDEDSDTRIPWMRKYAWESDPRISLPSFSDSLSEDCGVRRFCPLQTLEKIPLPVLS
jgi:5'-3' exonuclease